MKRLGLIEVKHGAVHAALTEDGVPAELHILEEGGREGAVYRGRVARIEKGANAAFLDLGGAEAFLPFRKAKRLNRKARSISGAVREGRLLLVRITAERGEDGKLPVAEPLAGAPVKGKPGLVRGAPPPLERALERLAAAGEILIDERTAWLGARKIAPEMKDRLTYYGEALPLFEAYRVADAIEHARAGLVPLGRGAHITVEATRAMTVIDVNGGALAPLEADLKAAEAIAQALRFQSIGGLVAADFIDLASGAERAKLKRALAAALARDPAKPELDGPNRFAIATIRRRYTGRPLRQALEDSR